MARGLKNVNEFKHLDSAPPLFLFRNWKLILKIKELRAFHDD